MDAIFAYFLTQRHHKYRILGNLSKKNQIIPMYVESAIGIILAGILKTIQNKRVPTEISL